MDNIEQVISDSISGLDGAESTDTIDTSNESVDDISASGSEDGSGDIAADDNTDTVAPPAAEPEDALAAELGINPKNKNNRIPYHRVQAIVKKAEEKYQAELQARDQRLAALSQFESPDFQQTLQALQLAEENPEQFLHILAQADPRYAQLLRREQAAEAQRQQAQPQPQAAEQEEIQPDVLLADGTLGYSPDAVRRMAAQQAQQVASQIEARLAQQFGPVAQAYQQHQQMTALRTQAQTKIQSEFQEAQNWPGFVENQQAMFEAVKNDPSIKTLQQAYFKVVLPKLAQSKDELRKQVLAEMNSRKPAAARAASGRFTSAPAAADPNKPRDIEDIIRESIAGLE